MSSTFQVAKKKVHHIIMVWCKSLTAGCFWGYLSWKIEDWLMVRFFGSSKTANFSWNEINTYYNIWLIPNRFSQNQIFLKIIQYLLYFKVSWCQKLTCIKNRTTNTTPNQEVILFIWVHDNVHNLILLKMIWY